MNMERNKEGMPVSSPGSSSQRFQSERVKRHFKCNITGRMCNNACKTQTKLAVHRRKNHSRGKPHKCIECSCTVRESFRLKEHNRIHTGVKPYECKECGYAASRAFRLKEHSRIHSGEKPYKCNACDYASCQSSHLKRHLRSHTKEKPYKCNVCDYASSQSSNLKTHLRSHTKKKSYKCNVCDFASSQSSNLKSHIRSHTTENPYKCDECQKSYTHKTKLVIHERTHSGDKPFVCQECGEAFARKDYLKVHSYYHTDEEPYRCHKCNVTFCIKYKLNRHKHRFHSPKSGDKRRKTKPCCVTLKRLIVREVTPRVTSGGREQLESSPRVHLTKTCYVKLQRLRVLPNNIEPQIDVTTAQDIRHVASNSVSNGLAKKGPDNIAVKIEEPLTGFLDKISWDDVKPNLVIPADISVEESSADIKESTLTTKGMTNHRVPDKVYRYVENKYTTPSLEGINTQITSTPIDPVIITVFKSECM